MDRDSNKTALREARRLARFTSLGLEPVCVYCGCADLWTLEIHHITCRNNDAALYEVRCKNCHAMATENLRREGVSTSRETSPRNRVIRNLRAMAVHYEMLAPAFRRWANDLERGSK